MEDGEWKRESLGRTFWMERGFEPASTFILEQCRKGLVASDSQVEAA
jgi:hypothetical protein